MENSRGHNKKIPKIKTMNCILCHSKKTKIVEVVTFEELEEIWKHSYVGRINDYLPETTFLLEECQDCNLQFFFPAISGEDKFYSLFRERDYYQIYWDHKEISKYILNYKLNSILDYGCGKGLFLNLLPENISKTGIDFNIRNQEKDNLKIIKTNLLEFQTEEKFEGVVCIQVLEHLKEPRRHLEKMVNLLGKHGFLFITVPNREGIHKIMENQAKSLDFPPHHLTRWSKKTLEKIAKICDLEIIDILEEPLSYNHFRWAMNMYVGTRYAGNLINRILRKILLLKQEMILPIYYFQFKEKVLGHSILAIFQKK